VADADDPAVAVITRLRHHYPNLTVRLLVAPAVGANRKVSILQRLTQEAKFEHLVISDSDIRVRHDYLRRVVRPLADPEVGLVTCPYVGSRAANLTAKLAALHIGVTFLPLALVGRLVLKGFAMGSTVCLSKYALDSMGGFAAIADHLADDYEIGARIAETGKRVVVSECVVETILGKPGLVDQWHRETRWMRCTRVSRPIEYPGLLLSLSTPLALVALIAHGFSPVGWLLIAGSLAVRWVVAWSITGITNDGESRRAMHWLPLRDLLGGLVWCAGFGGRCIQWRGERYILQKDGTMTPMAPTAGRARPRPGAAPAPPDGGSRRG
jgi:ceramide glucosyltransferase